jgi:putative addiction module component (TIGR02574 family)
MRQEVENVLREALSLPEIDRAEIAGALLESLEPSADSDVEAAWRQEVAKRIAVADAGQVPTIPWEEVRERLLMRLSEHRAD